MFQHLTFFAPVTRRRSGLAAINLGVSAAPARAETPIGEITGEVGAEAFVRETLDVPSEGTATAEFSDFGPVITVSIPGHEQGGESRMRNVESLDFSLMGSDVMDIDVSFSPMACRGPSISAPTCRVMRRSASTGLISTTMPRWPRVISPPCSAARTIS